jgi:hypothetical protein
LVIETWVFFLIINLRVDRLVFENEVSLSLFIPTLALRQCRDLYYSAIFLIKIFGIFCSSRPRHIISISEYSTRLDLGIFWSSQPQKDISISASTYLGLGIFESTQKIPCISLGNFKSTREIPYLGLGNFKSTRPRNAISVSASTSFSFCTSSVGK